MSTGADSRALTLAPDEAFAVLGNETRMEILQTLGQADEPLAFSELYEQVEYDTMTNFNYHLDKLVGHFVSMRSDSPPGRVPGPPRATRPVSQ